jgi:hypothetical protein
MSLVLRVLAATGLMTASIPAFAQEKPIVAVRQIEDLAGTGQAEPFSAMVQSAVAQTGRFRVMERDFDQLLAEQQEGNAGLTTTNTPGRTGQFEGADYLIYGTITAASAGRQADEGAAMGRGLASSLLGVSLGSTNCSRATATLAVDVKVVDGASGEIRYAKSLTQNSQTATSCSGDTALDATNMLRSVADQIASGLVTTVYPIQVATVQGDGTLILNYGDTALAPGMIMTVYGPSEEIPDPATGAIMRIDGSKLGFIEVTEAMPQFSRAKALSTFQTSPAAGAVVREASPEDAAQFRPKRRR